MSDSIQNSDYRTWLVELKTTIRQRQIKAALSVNSELIKLYWEMGRQIAEKQQQGNFDDTLFQSVSE